MGEPPPRPDPGRRRILFVGGKGGVGKTTTAAALALSLAARGERCLLVSTDPAHNLGDLFGLRIGERETRIREGLFALEVDPEAEADRHIDSVRRGMRSFVKPELYHEIDRQMELTRLSPGAVEAALLERMARLMLDAGERYDRVVFDTAPTGHTLRLLSLPEIMSAWMDGLLRHRDRADELSAIQRRAGPPPGEDLSFVDRPRDEDARSRRIRETLMERRELFARARVLMLDPEVTGFLLVLVPEKLPILESRMALDVLERFQVPVLGLVVNRVLPEGEQGAFLEARREQESEYLQRIRETFPAMAAAYLPLLARDADGIEGLSTLAEHLLPRG